MVIVIAEIESDAGLPSNVITQLSGIRGESYNSKLDKIWSNSQGK